MAGIGTDITEDGSPSAAARALRSVEERLDTRYGIILQTPAYTTYHVELGRSLLTRRDIRKMPESSAIIIHGSAVPRRFSVMAAGLSRSSKRPVLLIWKIRVRSAGPSRMSTVR